MGHAEGVLGTSSTFRPSRAGGDWNPPRQQPARCHRALGPAHDVVRDHDAAQRRVGLRRRPGQRRRAPRVVLHDGAGEAWPVAPAEDAAPPTAAGPAPGPPDTPPPAGKWSHVKRVTTSWNVTDPFDQEGFGSPPPAFVSTCIPPPHGQEGVS